VGIALIFIGFFLILLSAFLMAKKTEAAFVGFIGPIPIGVATNKKLLYFASILSLVLFLTFMFMFLMGKT